MPPDEAARRDKAKADELARLDAEIGRLKAERGTLDGTTVGGGPDLGFEAQTVGKAPGKPWHTEGTNTVLADAQSPFAHLPPPAPAGFVSAAGSPRTACGMSSIVR